jgi:hypothetical protein
MQAPVRTKKGDIPLLLSILFRADFDQAALDFDFRSEAALRVTWGSSRASGPLATRAFSATGMRIRG